jgi:hypothetical protein
VVAQEDYKAGDCDVVPVSDPNMATDMQRTTKAQATLEIAKEAGGDMRVAGLRALEAFRVDAPEEIFPKPQGPPPEDPRVIAAKAKAMNDGKQSAIDAALAHAEIGKTAAETAQIEANILAMGPEFMEAAQEYARRQVQAALAMVENGGLREQRDLLADQWARGQEMDPRQQCKALLMGELASINWSDIEMAYAKADEHAREAAEADAEPAETESEPQ